MPWIDLDDVHRHLNKTSSADDGELVGFIGAACAVIEDLKGHVDVVTVTEMQETVAVDQYAASYDVGYYGGFSRRRHMIVLRQWPVLTVSTVTAVAGGVPIAVVKGDPTTGVVGWWMQDQVLNLPHGAWGLYQIVYQAGRNPVPANFRLAALELVAHLWRASQVNAAMGRPQINADDTAAILPHLASALPYRVRELLGIYGEIVSEQIPIA
jgi:hypothetical protein